MHGDGPAQEMEAQRGIMANMLPFIELGPIKLPTYGFLLCVSLLAGIQWAVARAPRFGLPADFIYTLSCVSALVAVVGAKLTTWAIAGVPGTLEVMFTTAGTFLGGFLLAILTAGVTSYRAGYSIWSVGDCAAPAFALGVVLVRIGCFGASCDYGLPTDVPWGVVFTNPVAAQFTGIPLGLKLHPSQLYESALGLSILITLLWMERKPRKSGALVLTFATMYSIGRFVLEYWRGDVERGIYGPLSTSQWLSLGTVALFWAFFYWTAKARAASLQER